MGHLNNDDYMAALQEVVLSSIDHKLLRNDNIMFRMVDAEPLSPRFRVEMGVVITGHPVIASTLREKDPKAAGRRLAQYVNAVLLKASLAAAK